MSKHPTLGIVQPIVQIDRGEILETLDSLRKAIESGEVTCFVAVGVSPDDGTKVWTSCTHPMKSMLQVFGAVATLFSTFWDWTEARD